MLPLIVLAVPAAYGLYKAAKGVQDSSEAASTNDSAESIVRSAKNRTNEQRELTNKVIEDYGARKLRAFDGAIADFLETFGRLKNVELIPTSELDSLQVGEFTSTTLNGLRTDYQLLMSSGMGLGAGLTGGAALAFGAYNGTMLLATAGTGTAISTLSGAAATNATLAWLGGGSIAAGGGGVAMGTMVLGGLVAAPALAVLGFFVGKKGEEALANAQSNLEKARTFRDEMEKTITQLIAIEKVTGLANQTFSKVSGLLRRHTDKLKEIIATSGENYSSYSDEQKEVVFKTVKFAQLIKAMIDTPILDENGALVLSSEKRIGDIFEMSRS